MCVHGSQAVYCTTDLCLSVDKLKKEKNNNREKNDVSVQRSMSMECTFCPLSKLRLLTDIEAWLTAKRDSSEVPRDLVGSTASKCCRRDPAAAPNLDLQMYQGRCVHRIRRPTSCSENDSENNILSVHVENGRAKCCMSTRRLGQTHVTLKKHCPFLRKKNLCTCG